MGTELALQDPRLKAAEPLEITDHLHQLFASLPVKGGGDPQAVMKGYVVALQGYPDWAIGNAVRGFLRGTVPGASKSFCPRPPELAEAVRGELAHVHDELARKQREERWKAERVNQRRTQEPPRVETPRGPMIAEFKSSDEGLKLMRAGGFKPGTVFVFREGVVYGPPVREEIPF